MASSSLFTYSISDCLSGEREEGEDSEEDDQSCARKNARRSARVGRDGEKEIFLCALLFIFLELF